MKTIHDFKKHDFITRIQPAKSINNGFSLFSFMQENTGDRSFIGEKLEFIGIANGCIYVKVLTGISVLLFKNPDELIKLQLDTFTDGWDYYVEPESLLDDEYICRSDKNILEQKIEQAIKDENFELAEKLKEQLNKLS